MMGKVVLYISSGAASAGASQARPGEMSEWFKEPVLKTGDRASDRGFESHSLRHFNLTVLDRNVPWSSTQVGDEAPLLRA